MTVTTAQRGEAHLWLLVEEALVAVGRTGAEPWEVRRNFGYVSEALTEAGVVSADVAKGLRRELDAALAVRRALPPAMFSWAAPALGDEPAARAPEAEPGASGAVWLEAEIERHLDLLGAYDPATVPAAGAHTLRILAGPVRALEAAGVLGMGKALMADLVASIAAAGFDAGGHVPGEGRLRREWVRFLRDRPPPLPAAFVADASAAPRTTIGRIGERNVRVDEVAWSADALELRVALRAVQGVGARDRTPWHARALDHRGRLHLGQPVTPIVDGGAAATFRLRPGIEEHLSVLQVRLTSAGRRVEGEVTW